MATDLIQRAAAIVGVPSPNSDQIESWLNARGWDVRISNRSQGYVTWARDRNYSDEIETMPRSSMLECLAAAVVEVDRIEREAAK